MTGSRRIAILAFCFLQAILIAPRAAQAHEARPAYLEVKETAPTHFSLLWRTPVMAGTRLPIVLTIPGVRNLKTPEIEELSDSFVERRWIDAGPEGLAGKRIEFVGLQLAYHSGVIRVTEKFKLGVVAATVGIAVFYLVQFVLGFFGVRFAAINGSGLLRIGFSVVVVIVSWRRATIQLELKQSPAIAASRTPPWLVSG